MELVFQVDLSNKFFRRGKTQVCKNYKIALTNPTIFVFKICFSPDLTYYENFGRFH